MKIAIVHGSNDNYGASRVLLQEIRCLLALGHSVHLLVPTTGPLESQIARLGRGVQISVLPNLLILRRSRLADALRRPGIPVEMQSADVVVLWTLAVAAYIPILRFRRKRFYLAVHELLEDRFARVFFRFLVMGKFQITACSHATARWLESIGAAKERVTVTYPVVELESRHDVVPTRRVPSEPVFTVGVYGRINGHKGHLEVAKAFQTNLLSDPSWRLILAGAPFPGQEDALAEVRDVARADQRIALVGELPSIDHLGAEVDLVAVFPTRPEPFGLVPLEAWSVGIRSIGYSDGGSQEVFAMVDGIAVDRTASPTECIARALAEWRSRLDGLGPLPPKESVLPKLSFEGRTKKISLILAAAAPDASDDV